MESDPQTVMVVDDEDPVRESARAALEARGFAVLTARNSVEALLLSNHHRGPIHLLVTDLSMPPYMDGQELARALQEMRPGLRVLYLSAQEPDALALDGLEGGRTGFLVKPFAAEALAARARDILAGPGPEAASPEAGAPRSILMMVPEAEVRASVAGLLRGEGYQVIEVRNIGEALTVSQWHVGPIGLLLADRVAWARLPGEFPERLGQIRPEMRILCASISDALEAPLGERVRRALEEWGLEAQDGA